MCKRDTADPLVRMFLDRFKINLLAVPRARAACGDVYVRNGRRVSSGIRMAELLEPRPTLPPTNEGEELADLAGILSDAVSVDVGFGLLQSFLAAIGAGGLISSVSAGVENSRTRSLRFRFTDATLDSIDAGALGSIFESRRLRSTHPLLQPGNEYFVTAGVVRSPSVSVIGEGNRRRRVELGAEIMAVAQGKVGHTVEQSDSGEVTFRGSKPLAIGLQLYELRDSGEEARLTMLAQDPRDPVKAVKDRPPKPAFAAPDGEALLTLEQPSRDEGAGEC